MLCKYDKSICKGERAMKKETFKTMSAVVALVGLLSSMVIGCGTTAKDTTIQTETSEETNDISEAIEDVNEEGQLADTVADNEEDSVEINETEPEVEEPEAEGPYEFVLGKVEMNEDDYNKYIEIGKSLKDKEKLNGHELCEMLAALSYQYDWASTEDAGKLENLQDFMGKATLFWGNLDETSSAALYETLYVINDTGMAEEGLDSVLFDRYVNISDYAGIDLTYNDVLYTMYVYYKDNIDEFKTCDSLLRTLQDGNNIVKFPFMENEDIQYFDQLYLYGSMWSSKYLIDNGYKATHVLELENPAKFFKASEDNQSVGETISSKYIVPVIVENENEKQTKEVICAFLDDDYNVVNLIPYNAEYAEELDQDLFKYLLSK